MDDEGWASTSKVPIRDEDGRVMGMLGPTKTSPTAGGRRRLCERARP